MSSNQSEGKIKTIGIFGLGRFGSGLARRLSELGAEVLAVDSDPDKVEAIDPMVARAVCLDATNEYAVSKLNLEDLELAVVSIGRDIQAGLLVTAVLQKCGMSNIIVRAIDQNQAEILHAMGVSRIISLEREMANSVAENLLQPGLQRIASITAGHSLAEVQAKGHFVGKTLQELDMRNTYGVNVVAIQSTETVAAEDGRERSYVSMNDLPSAGDLIKEGDILMVIGSDEKIKALQAEL